MLHTLTSGDDARGLSVLVEMSSGLAQARCLASFVSLNQASSFQLPCATLYRIAARLSTVVPLLLYLTRTCSPGTSL
jgi:hypothetical protein